jgi:hypothetical protein
LNAIEEVTSMATEVSHGVSMNMKGFTLYWITFNNKKKWAAYGKDSSSLTDEKSRKRIRRGIGTQ